jgi:hypothetical protein
MFSFAIPEGGSMVGKVREFGHEELLPLAFGFAEDQSVDCRDPRMVMVGDTGVVYLYDSGHDGSAGLSGVDGGVFEGVGP